VAEYRQRVVDHELDELLPGAAAIAIEGAKAVGKTATASRRAAVTYAIDDTQTREVLEADPSLIDRGERPVLIDEWQRLPRLWDHVRRQVDDGAPPGSYLLTGSAVPSDAPVHTGAGRILSLRMRPLSLAERGLIEPTVSVAELLAGTRPLPHGISPVKVPDYADEILASGLPGVRAAGSARVRRAQLAGYLDRVVNRDFAEQGVPVRRPEALRAWLTAYAAATATTATYRTVTAAASPGDPGPKSPTTERGYRDVLQSLYLIEPVPGWTPSRSHLSKAAQSPKHHLVDPALAAGLLGVDAGALLRGESSGPMVPRDGTLLGALFESLVTLSLRVYAQAAEAQVRHFRTRDGAHEADLIIERRDQRVVACEVKLSASPGADSVKHLLWLRERLGDDLLDAVVITTGEHAYRREDGIAVVPAALLGP
jgi:predicted AAA+ superfamily ATPase